MTRDSKAVEKALHDAWADHSRLFENNKWAYPVVSRRAGGISIGVNLNLDKSCSFRCAYCQVDRTVPGIHEKLDLNALEHEIVTLIEEYKKTGLVHFSNFADLPQERRQIRDICLSGDGESTLVPEFLEVCSLMYALQERYAKYNLQLTLITNATHLQDERVVKGLKFLTQKKGEIWAKLDAGTAKWLKIIDKTAVSIDVIQSNLENTVKAFPMRIQTMLCKIGELYPSDFEIEQYIERVIRVYRASSKNFLGVQLYGVVRHTALPDVVPLPKEFLEQVALRIKERIPVTVEVF